MRYSIVLMLVVFLLAGCGGGSGRGQTAMRPMDTPPPVEEPEEEEEETTEEPDVEETDQDVVDDENPEGDGDGEEEPEEDQQPEDTELTPQQQAEQWQAIAHATETAIEGIVNRATGILMSDWKLDRARTAQDRLQASCSGAQCTVSAITGTVAYSIPDVEPFVIASPPSDPQNGVSMMTGTSFNNPVFNPSTAGSGSVDGTYLTFGGWLDDSFFGYIIGTSQGGTLAGLSTQGVGATYAFSVGALSGSTPVSGSAQWDGAMVGSQAGDRLQGDATLTFDFASTEMDAAFTNIQNLTAALDGLDPAVPDILWNDLPTRHGRFGIRSVQGEYLEGYFYGANHEEVGGVFERNNLIGAFGATR